MKKALIAVVIICLFFSCKKSSSTNVESEYVLKPNLGTLKVLGEYNINLDGATKTGNYAVISIIIVNSVTYVAIAVDNDNVSDTNFNLKIYFPANQIPASINLDNTNSTIKARDDAGTLYTNAAGSYTLNFSGPDANNVYTITSTGDITLSPGSKILQIYGTYSIKAVKVPR